MRRLLLSIALILIALTLTLPASAFSYVVRPGDTLASIAERFYGRIQHEKLLVAANTLEAHGGTPIRAGMLLQIPALSHHRVRKGESWPDLALRHLGAKQRADVLAGANGTSPWVPPQEGAEIAIPYNLKVIVTGKETIVNVAHKYLGEKNKAWVLDHYNGFKGRRLLRGDARFGSPH